MQATRTFNHHSDREGQRLNSGRKRVLTVASRVGWVCREHTRRFDPSRLFVQIFSARIVNIVRHLTSASFPVNGSWIFSIFRTAIRTEAKECNFEQVRSIRACSPNINFILVILKEENCQIWIQGS